jgi:hypothetical protein
VGVNEVLYLMRHGALTNVRLFFMNACVGWNFCDVSRNNVSAFDTNPGFSSPNYL